MNEKILRTIAAGDIPYIEIVDPGDGITVILRYAQNPEKNIKLDASILETLGNSLIKAYREYYNE